MEILCLLWLLWFGWSIFAYIWLSTSTESIYDKPTVLWSLKFVFNKVLENNSKLTLFGKILFIPIHVTLLFPISGAIVFVFFENSLEFFVKNVLYKSE